MSNLYAEVVASGPEKVRIKPGRGDHMKLEVWKELCALGMFIPWDGSGSWATETHEFTRTSVWSAAVPPEGTTHVMWYNR